MLEKIIRDLIPHELNTLLVKNNIRFSLLRNRNVLTINLYGKNISFDVVFSSDLATCSVKSYSRIENFHEPKNDELEVFSKFLYFLNDNIEFIKFTLSQELSKIEEASRTKFYKSLQDDANRKNLMFKNFHFKVINTITEEESCTNRTGKDNIFYCSKKSSFRIDNVDQMGDAERQVIHKGLEKLSSYENNSEYSYSPCHKPTTRIRKNLIFFLTRKITAIHNRDHKLVDFTIIFDQYAQSVKEIKKNDYQNIYYSNDLIFYSTLIKTLLFLILNGDNEINVDNKFFWSDIEIFTNEYKYPSQNKSFESSNFQNVASIKDYESFSSGMSSLINFYTEKESQIEEKIKKLVNEKYLEDYIFNSYYDYEILLPQEIKGYFIK